MAEDFPEDKYDFKPASTQRSFAEQLLHAAGSNDLFTATAKGEKVVDDEAREHFKTKAAVVAYVKKSFAEGENTTGSWWSITGWQGWCHRSRVPRNNFLTAHRLREYFRAYAGGVCPEISRASSIGCPATVCSGTTPAHVGKE